MDNQAASAAKTPPNGTPAETGKSAAFDPKTKTLCIHALQSLRAGFSQALLYSQETRQYEKVVETTFEALNAAVEALNGFHLSISRSEAIINAQRLDTPLAARSSIDQIDRFIYNAGLSSVKFDKGLTRQEIGPFLQVVARKKFVSSDGAAINNQLREMGVSHILVGELRYVGLTEGEQVVTRTQSPSSANHSGVQDAVSEMADSFQSRMDLIQDVEARKQLQVEMTGQLIEKDDAMLASLLMVGAEHLREIASEEIVALAALPRRDGELLNSILRLGRQVLLKGIDQDDQIFVSLRDFIQKLTEPYRRRAEDILNLLEYDEMTAFLLPEWLRRAAASLKGGSAEERLEGILVQSPNALLDERMFPQILDVLDELSVARLDEHAERLTTHVAGAVKAPTKKMRIKAVQRLSKLLERSMEQTSNAVKIIEDALLDACLHETCDEVMVLLLEHLAHRSEHHYTLENYERSLEHIEFIASLELASRSAMRAEAVNMARKTREKLLKSEFAKGLLKDILAPEPKGHVAVRMIQLLGKELWLKLIDLIVTTPDIATARTLTTHFASFGKDAHVLFFSLFERADNRPAMVRLLDVAPLISVHPALWKPAFNLLMNPDSIVRDHAVDAVLKLDPDISYKTIFEALREDRDPAHRSGLLAAVARTSDPKALAMLIEELNSALSSESYDEMRVVLALDALSGFEHEDLIEPVASLICPKHRTHLNVDRALSKTVTIAAIKSLAKMYKHPNAIEALERARTHKDPEISRLALAAQRGLVAAKHQYEEVPPTIPPSSASAPAVTVVNAVAAKSGGATAIRRRSFEDAPDSSGATGSSILRGTPKQAGGSTTITRAIPREGSGTTAAVPPTPDAKPILEGRLEDVGLINTVRMIGGRDGTLVIGAANTDVRMTIRGRKIIHCIYGDKYGVEALTKIYEIQEAPFAYFSTLPAPPANMEIEINNIDQAIREFFRTGAAPDETAFY